MATALVGKKALKTHHHTTTKKKDSSNGVNISLANNVKTSLTKDVNISLTKWADTNIDVFLIEQKKNNVKLYLFPEEVVLIINNYKKLKNIIDLHNFDIFS